MTHKRIMVRLVVVIVALVSILSLSLVEYFLSPPGTQRYISSNATLITLVFATYIAYLFQQKTKLIDDLRRWWNEIVEAKALLYAYCDRAKPSESEYLAAFYKLSTCMDALRLIYCNVARDEENPKGYYPFEQVRDIVDLARTIAPACKPDRETRAKVKQSINVIFQSLRHAIQEEAGAHPPDNPTLWNSPFRQAYLRQVRERFGFDLEEIRQRNKLEGRNGA